MITFYAEEPTISLSGCDIKRIPPVVIKDSSSYGRKPKKLKDDLFSRSHRKNPTDV